MPRIDLWHNAQVIRGTLPKKFTGMGVEDIHHAMGWPLHKFVPEYSRPENPADLLHRGIGLFDLKEFPYSFTFSNDVDIRVQVEADEREEMFGRAKAGGLGYGDVKKDLLARILDHFAPMRARREELEKRPDDIEVILEGGARRARAIGAPVLAAARDAAGLG